MGKRVECVVLIHAEILAGDEQRPGRPKRYVASAVSHCRGPDCSRRIVPGSGDHLYVRRQPQFLCDLRLQTSHRLPALIQLRKLLRCDAADLHHLPGPALMLYIQEQHAGGIGIFRAECSRKPVRKVIFREHDLTDPSKILRLILLHPEDLWSRKSRKCNICRVFRKFFLSYNIIQIIRLFSCPPVIPEDRRTDHIIVFIQRHKTVHLPAEADPFHLCPVTPGYQFSDPFHALRKPVFRLLF